MRMREFFTVQTHELGFLWKVQMLFGALLVLTAVAILVFPEILVALVAGGILLAGAAMIGSAWRMRRLHNSTRGFSILETFEW